MILNSHMVLIFYKLIVLVHVHHHSFQPHHPTILLEKTSSPCGCLQSCWDCWTLASEKCQKTAAFWEIKITNGQLWMSNLSRTSRKRTKTSGFTHWVATRIFYLNQQYFDYPKTTPCSVLNRPPLYQHQPCLVNPHVH